MSYISQPLDSLAIINTMVVGLAPANALGSQYVTQVYHLTLANYNQVFAMNQSYMQQQAAAVVGIKKIWGD